MPTMTERRQDIFHIFVFWERDVFDALTRSGDSVCELCIFWEESNATCQGKEKERRRQLLQVVVSFFRGERNMTRQCSGQQEGEDLKTFASCLFGGKRGS